MHKIKDEIRAIANKKLQAVWYQYIAILTKTRVQSAAVGLWPPKQEVSGLAREAPSTNSRER